MINEVWHGDCLELMKAIPDKSIDMILCDLPYGITACKWDSVIPFDLLWEQYKRIIKDNRAIVLTASQPFTSALVMSNPKWFKEELIFCKSRGSNFLQSKYRHMRSHENILIFSNGKNIYNPQMREGKPYTRLNCRVTSDNYKKKCNEFRMVDSKNEGFRYPLSQLFFARDKTKLHPTQKPVDLFSYLIRTYSNEGDLILDNTAGSGTTAIAALETGRNYLLIEQEQKYIDVINCRIEEYKEKKASEPVQLEMF